MNVESTINHIPNYYFSNGIRRIDFLDIKLKYGDDKWDEAKRYLSPTRKITKSALRITEVIKEHFDIELFPLIIKIATKGFDLSGGTYAFQMIDDTGNSVYFDCRARNYKAMSGKYYSYVDHSSYLVLSRSD